MSRRVTFGSVLWLAALTATAHAETATMSTRSATAVRSGTIAYARFPPAGISQLFSVEASGRRQTRLLRHDGSDSEPSWSADGRQIAFTSISNELQQGIFVATPDGRRVRQLTRHISTPTSTFLDAHPRWSPDGRQLVFHRFRNSGSTLFVMKADGAALRRLGLGFEPAWSPDGRQIAFARRVGEFGDYDIYIMNADGTRSRRVTTNPANDNDPDWSPDGRWLAFESKRNDNNDIYAIRTDGKGQRRLTHAPGHDVSPVWSPNGKWIAFASHRVQGQFDLFVMNADGSEETRLTRDLRMQDAQPSWRPLG